MTLFSFDVLTEKAQITKKHVCKNTEGTGYRERTDVLNNESPISLVKFCQIVFGTQNVQRYIVSSF